MRKKKNPDVCVGEGCVREAKVRGRCINCYNLWRKSDSFTLKKVTPSRFVGHDNPDTVKHRQTKKRVGKPRGINHGIKVSGTDPGTDRINWIEQKLCIPETGVPFILEDFQKDFIWNAFSLKPNGERKHDKAVLSISRKNAKSLDLRTPIPTPTGWTTMGDIKEGDRVFDCDGNICSVTYVSRVFNKPCYQISFSNGEKVIASEDHLWTVESHSRPCGSVSNIKTTKDIFTNHTKLKLIGHADAVKMPDPLDLPPKDLPIYPYVLGVWLGDGSKSGTRISSSLTDFAELSYYIHEAGYDVNFQHYPGKDRDNAVTLALRPTGGQKRKGRCPYNGFKHALKDLGILNSKSIPVSYLRASKHQRLALLQGLMDTDGTINKKGNNICICSSFPKLASGIKELLSSLGIKFSVHIRQTTHLPSHQFQFNTFRDALPVFRLRRKLDRMKNLSDVVTRPRSLRAHFDTIETCPTVPTRCIAVDSPSHTYLFGRTMLPTHNTTLCAAISICELCGPWAQGYSMPVASYNREAASVLYKQAVMIARKSGLLAEDRNRKSKLRALETWLVLKNQETGGELKTLSADAASSIAMIPGGIIIVDELGWHKKRDLYDAMDTSRGALDPLMIIIGTLGPIGSVLNEIVDSQKAHPLQNRYVKVHGADINDDPFNPATWLKANPGLGTILKRKVIERDAQEARFSKAKLRVFKYHQLNIPATPGIDDFVGADVWLLGKTEAPPLGPLFLGLDLSETTDLTVLALYWPETGRLDFRVYTVEKDIKMRAEQDNIPYDDLPAGQLHIAGQRIIDYSEVGADLKLLNYEHDVRGIACDPHKIKVLQDKMEEAGIDLANFPPFINISQTIVGMTGGLEEFERQMKEGHIKHNNSVLLQRSLSAAKVYTDGNLNRKFMKNQTHGKRIDAAVAASMAVGLAHDRLSPKRDKDEQRKQDLARLYKQKRDKQEDSPRRNQEPKKEEVFNPDDWYATA